MHLLQMRTQPADTVRPGQRYHKRRCLRRALSRNRERVSGSDSVRQRTSERVAAARGIHHRGRGYGWNVMAAVGSSIQISAFFAAGEDEHFGRGFLKNSVHSLLDALFGTQQRIKFSFVALQYIARAHPLLPLL